MAIDVVDQPGGGPIGQGPIGGTPDADSVTPIIVPPGEIIWTGRAASYGLDALAVPYEGRLLNSADLEITRELADPLWNATPTQSVTLELNNSDGALTPWYLQDPRNAVLTLTRYDRQSGFLATKFTGQVLWPRLTEHRLTVECGVLDRALFTDPLPAPVVTTDLFPNAVDVGATIPVVLGNVPRMPCPNVSDDKVKSLFDYLVGHGTLAVTDLARNGLNDSSYSIQFSECVRADGSLATSWAEVARTDLYPGYTVVRFILRQQDFNNGLHKIYANVTGPAATRNFAHAIGTLLSDTTWGLRQSVNAASIDAAAAVLDALPVPLYCDGAMLAPKPGQEWLSDLLMVRGMWLDLDAAGAITLQVDQPRTTVAMAIGHDPGDGPKNLVSLRERSGPAPEERIRQLVVKYRLDYVRNVFIGQAQRDVNPDGKTREIPHAFLRDAGSADLVTDYVGKRILVGQETAEDAVVTQEARALVPGDLVSLTHLNRGFYGNIMEVWKIAERLTTLTLTLRGWSWATYAYTPGVLPADPLVGTELDFSRTAPSPVTGLTVGGGGTTMTVDGQIAAYVILAFTTPSGGNFAFAVARYRVTGTTLWTEAGRAGTVGPTTAVVNGLLPGTPYDFDVAVYNAFGLVSTGNPTLTNQTTAGDSTGPSPATGLSLSSSGTLIAGDGRVSAWIVLSFTTPAAGQYRRAVARYRVTGTTLWIEGPRTEATGATTLRLEGLLPDTAYDYSIRVYGVLDRFSTGDPTLTNQVSPSDATVPTAPSAIAVRQSGAKVVEISPSFAIPDDWATADLYRNTANNSATATQIDSKKAWVFHDENVAYGTTYYYWVKVVDTSGNASGFSPSSGHSVLVAQIDTSDVGDTTITTPKIAPNAVTNSVRHIGTGGASTTSGTEADISGETVTLTISDAASIILITWNATATLNNDNVTTLGTVFATFKLYRGGSQIYRTDISMPVIQNSGIFIPVSMQYQDTGVSGSTTYKIRWFVLNTVAGVTALLASGSVLQATEMKR